MAQSNCERILIVGDGNFSFSMQFLKRCEHDAKNCLLTATSLDTEEILSKNQEAFENVKALRNSDQVKVIHGVDATRLGDQFHGKQFHKVIFNFPHTGGKSNVRRCRELLRDFFTSVADHLAPGAHVLVSLCRGQGGTPSDDIKRGYSNSWTIPTEATKSGFILIDVRPFLSSGLPAYSCAGYRGQLQKGFILERALVHTFALGLPVPKLIWRKSPDKENLKGIVLEGMTNLLKPDSIHRQILGKLVETLNQEMSKLRCLNSIAGQEMGSVDLGKVMNTAWSLDTFLSQPALDTILQKASESCRSKEWASTIVTSSLSRCTTLSACEPYLHHKLIFSEPCDNPKDIRTLQQTVKAALTNLCSKTKLKIVESKHVSAQTDLTVFERIVQGPSERKFDPHKIPYFLEDLGRDWQCMQPEITVTCNEDTGVSVTKETVYKNTDRENYIPSPVELSYLQSDPSPMLQNEQVDYTFLFDVMESETVLARGGIVNFLDRNSTSCANLSKKAEYSDVHSTNPAFFVIFHAENILSCRYQRDDLRIFTSMDTVYLQGVLNDMEVNGNATFRPTLLHPLCYRHDLCFWLDYNITEALLMDIVRYVTNNLIHSMKLLRILNHKENDCVSYCYRMLYSRCDGPLTKNETVEIQNKLRLLLLDYGFKLR